MLRILRVLGHDAHKDILLNKEKKVVEKCIYYVKYVFYCRQK